ncbi:MAG TPA: enoyl-CoA hydratase-related protein [Flavihumibacter sp.]
MTEPIDFTIQGGVARIVLNRPDKLNSFNREMAFRLQAALNACHKDPIRVVLITGAGKAFCAGQDLAEVVDPRGPNMDQILSEHYNPIVTAIHDLAKPVVAAVNGVAAGAGANLALSCDIVIAARSASFIQAFSKIGLIPDTGGTWFLPRMIGYQKASALMMLGEKVGAEDAERIGMIYKWFEDDQFMQQAEQMAAKLATMPTTGLAYTKKALQWSLNSTLTEQLTNEDQLQQKAAATEDFREGVVAFLEKRQPVFKGK